MDNRTVLIVHDGTEPAKAVEEAVTGGGWRHVVVSARQRDWHLKGAGADCAVFSLDVMDPVSCARMIERVKSADENMPAVVVARSKAVENAVAAMRAGAHDYIPYPADAEGLRIVIAKAMDLYSLTKRVYLLENQAGWRGAFDDMIGHSAPMQDIFNMISMVAKTGATVLISGESGTGKELVAQAIHRHSPRCKKSFIDINCGAIPRELLENELFGHERGSYTGADRRYIGSCERADGGTLFLDEISEMDPLLQVKLLRFLQERSFSRVGGEEPIKVDVRVLTATNRDITKEVAEGRFREDLFYRLNVVPIHIPPLRERKEDIPLLAKHFLDKYTAKTEKIFLDFAPQAMEALINYDWPGNVRELENIIERTVVLHNDSRVKLSHLPPFIAQGKGRAAGTVSFSEMSMSHIDGQKVVPLGLVEKYAIEAALRKCMGNVAEAARKLKIGQATLYRKIKEFGLK